MTDPDRAQAIANLMAAQDLIRAALERLAPAAQTPPPPPAPKKVRWLGDTEPPQEG